MATLYGWTGKILRVDLTTGKITETPTSDYVPKYIGGRGVGARIYWETVPPECGAFDPENALIFMTGAAAGTFAPTATHMYVGCKSPAMIESECYSWSEPGGHFSAELKFAGYDGVVLTGKSPKPVYLWINDGKAELRNADRLWGMWMTNLMLELKNLHGPESRVAAIGPAGENLCRQAPIIIEHQHATGYPGQGAVMGSKNLKAIAVRGTGAVTVAKPQEQIDLWYHYRRLLTRTPEEFAATGEWPHRTRTLCYYIWHHSHPPYCVGHPEEPDLAGYHKNWGEDDPWLTDYVRERLDDGRIDFGRASCYACPVGCALRIRSKDIDMPAEQGQCNDLESLPQYTWAGTGGSHRAYPHTPLEPPTQGKLWGEQDMWYNHICDELGLSKTSTIGYHLVWFMELVDQGYITPEDFPDFDISKPWTSETIRGLMEMIAYRRGIGDELAEGEVRYLKSLYDQHPDDPALKGVYDGVVFLGKYHLARVGYPRPVPDKHIYRHGWSSSADGMLQMATQTREEVQKTNGGGKSYSASRCVPEPLTAEEATAVRERGDLLYFGHKDATKSSKSWEYAPHVSIVTQNLQMIQGSISYCAWAGAHLQYSNLNPPDYLGDWEIGRKELAVANGIEMTQDEIIEAGEMMFNLERCIHVREGRRREHDMLPDWHFEDDGTGLTLGSWTTKDEFSDALTRYYTERGWDPNTAIPRRSTLERLGLKDVADDLESKYGVTLLT